MNNIEDIHARLGRIESVLLEIKEDIGWLKARAAVMGAVAGTVFGALTGALFKWVI
jgi:hypothetical protein